MAKDAEKERAKIRFELDADPTDHARLFNVNHIVLKLAGFAAADSLGADQRTWRWTP